MGIRTVSGAAYVAILIGFFLLRTVSPLFFNAFIWFLSFMGAFEVARCVKPFSFKGGMAFAVVFGIGKLVSWLVTTKLRLQPHILRNNDE